MMLYLTMCIFAPVLGTITVCLVSYYVVKYLQNRAKQVPLRDSKVHSWKPIKLSSRVSEYNNQFADSFNTEHNN